MTYKRNVRFYLTLWFVKCLTFFMRLIGRQATCTPGIVALKLCPDFMGRIEKPKLVVAVTGTNGKTTVCNMIDDILEDNGYHITNNRYGSNIDAGVVSALISGSNLRGRAKNEIAILEVDERSSLKIYPYLKPNYIVCTNLFRDSLRRNAHTEFISYIINRDMPPEATLILNGDDLIASGLGSDTNKKVYFGIHRLDTDSTEFGSSIRDIINCPRCDTRLVYDYIRYNHIGRAHCPLCGFRSPDCEYFVTDIDRTANTVTVAQYGQEYTYPMVNDNIINIYNMTAAIALLSEIGLTPEQLRASLSHIKPVKSRYNAETYLGKTLITQLAKGQNPIACSRGFQYVGQAAGQKALILTLDDKYDAAHSSENPAWLFETDYSPLTSDSITQIIVGGKRRYDQYLRLLMAGVPADRIYLTEHETDTYQLVDFSRCDTVYILHDIFILDVAQKIKASLKERLDREISESGNQKEGA